MLKCLYILFSAITIASIYEFWFGSCNSFFQFFFFLFFFFFSLTVPRLYIKSVLTLLLLVYALSVLFLYIQKNLSNTLHASRSDDTIRNNENTRRLEGIEFTLQINTSQLHNFSGMKAHDWSSDHLINILVASDEATLVGIPTLVHSIFANSQYKELIRVYIVVNDNLTALRVKRWIQVFSLPQKVNLQIKIKVFPTDLVKDKIKIRGRRKELGSPVSAL